MEACNSLSKALEAGRCRLKATGCRFIRYSMFNEYAYIVYNALFMIDFFVEIFCTKMFYFDQRQNLNTIRN